VRKKKTGTKKRTRTGKKMSGAGRKAPDKSLSSFLPFEFAARFFETYFNPAFLRRR